MGDPSIRTIRSSWSRKARHAICSGIKPTPSPASVRSLARWVVQLHIGKWCEARCFARFDDQRPQRVAQLWQQQLCLSKLDQLCGAPAAQRMTRRDYRHQLFVNETLLRQKLLILG